MELRRDAIVKALALLFIVEVDSYDDLFEGPVNRARAHFRAHILMSPSSLMYGARCSFATMYHFFGRPSG
jgi:hypothetical protein